MTITVVVVHPTITIIQTDHGQVEVPTNWFSVTPKAGQTWTVTLEHQPSETEKLDQLNAYIARE